MKYKTKLLKSGCIIWNKNIIGKSHIFGDFKFNLLCVKEITVNLVFWAE